MARSVSSMKTEHRQSEEEEAAAVPPFPSSSPSLSPQSKSESESASQQTTSLPVSYYIERPGVTRHTASGTVMTPGPSVPLIAVDQLPTWIDIINIPRELSREQTVSLSSLGTVPKGKSYKVYISPLDHGIPCSQMDPTAKPFHNQKGGWGQGEGQMKARDNDDDDGYGNDRHPLVGLHQRLPPPTVHEGPPENPYPVMYDRTTKSSYYKLRCRSKKQEQYPAERLLRAFYDLANSSPPPSSPQSTDQYNPTPPPRKTHNNNTNGSSSRSRIYCRHWCYYGKCKWDEACRYRHDMPRTTKELREIGLARYPGWWETHLQLLSTHVTRQPSSEDDDAGTTRGLHTANPIDMNMDTDTVVATRRATKRGMHGIPVGYLKSMMTPGFLPYSSRSQRQLSNSPSFAGGGKKKQKKQRQQQRKYQNLEIKHREEERDDSDDDGSEDNTPLPSPSAAEVEEYQHHTVRSSNTINDSKATGAKKKCARRNSSSWSSASTSTSTEPSPDHNTSTSSSPSPSPSTDNKTPKRMTESANRASDSKKTAQDPRSRTYAQARNIGGNARQRHRNQNDHRNQAAVHRQPRTQIRASTAPIRRRSYSPDVFERELATAAAADAEKGKQEEAEKQPKKGASQNVCAGINIGVRQ